MKKQHNIGEVFTHNGFTLTVKEGGFCPDCHFSSQKCDFEELECREGQREDMREVLFEDKNFIGLMGNLREAIEIESYQFKLVEFLPQTKQLSVSILVDSEKCFILHAVKPNPKEIADSLNEQYERFMNTEHEQVELKSVVDIPFKCPYMSDSCPFVDTMTATRDKNCSECENYINE